jgi:hypothetical protein
LTYFSDARPDTSAKDGVQEAMRTDDEGCMVTHRLRFVVVLMFVCCCSTAQAQSCTPAPPGLVSWWTGDTNENDIIGGNNHVVAQAVTLVPGEVKSGFTFGKDGYIQISDAANLANQTFTWLAWVMPAGPAQTTIPSAVSL